MSAKALEQYSLDGLLESSLVAVEEHLLVCGACRVRLEEIEPVKYIHHTEDGPVYARITRLATGRVMARLWGQDLHAGKAFGSFYAAKEYLSASFSRMYPEHQCRDACGAPQFREELGGEFCDRILRDLAHLV